MLDISQLRRDLPAVVARLETRKNPQPFLDVAAFGALEAERKTLQTHTEDLQARRNSLSKQIGMLKGKGEDTAPAMAEVAGIGDELKASSERLAELQGRFNLFNLQSGGKVSMQKSAEALLNDYRSATLGRVTLETPEGFAAWRAEAEAARAEKLEKKAARKPGQRRPGGR